jgi:hypothetical protein
MWLGIGSDQELSGVSMVMRSGLGGMMPEGRTGDFAMRRLSNEVTRDAKYGDAGQDQQRHCASYAAPQTIAREMTAHGPSPSDTFNQPTAAGLLGSAPCQGLRPT